MELRPSEFGKRVTDRLSGRLPKASQTVDGKVDLDPKAPFTEGRRLRWWLEMVYIGAFYAVASLTETSEAAYLPKTFFTSPVFFSILPAMKSLSTVCATVVSVCTIGRPLRIASAKLRANRASVALSMILPATGIPSLNSSHRNLPRRVRFHQPKPEPRQRMPPAAAATTPP